MRAFHELGECIQLLAGIVCATFGADTAYILGIGKDAKTLVFRLLLLCCVEDVLQLNKGHAETSVGLVAAIVFHGVRPRHTRQFGQVYIENGLEQVTGHTFEHIQYVFLFYKGHLAVDLGELRLAVGTQVLVAEALDNLEVTVESAHHEQLLQYLRALRQCVELPGIHAARYDKVTCAFRCRVDKDRCLHLKEALFVQVAAYFKSHLVAQLEVLAYA